MSTFGQDIIGPPTAGVLRALRVERNLSQRALAARIHRSNARIVGWEHGRCAPTVEELALCDTAFRLPKGATGALVDHSAGPAAAKDIETYELRSRLPRGALDLVTVAVQEEVQIARRGVYLVRVWQRVHAVRRNPGSYWFPYAVGTGRPTIRVSPEWRCTQGGWPRLLTAGRVAQEIRLAGGPMEIGEEREFRFTIRYDNWDNPVTETGIHRRVGTPTLTSIKMRVMVPPGGAIIKQATWTDRATEPVAGEVHLLRQAHKVLHWDRPSDQTCGFLYWLAS